MTCLERPHIMLVISSLGAGGAERVMSELAEFLVTNEYVVTLATLEGNRNDHYKLSERVKRLRLDVMWDSSGLLDSITSTVRRFQILRRAVRQSGADLVISFVDMTNIRVLLSLLGTGIPVVIAERTDPRHHRIGRSWERLRRYCYPLAEHLVVQTPGVALWARTWLPEKKISIIPNAIRPLGSASGCARPFGLPAGKIVMGMGRLSHEKGFDRLIQAFCSSGLAQEDWSLVILGEGPQRASLSSQATSLGIADRVILPGVQAKPDQWLRHADIFVLSSRYEGFPNALIEAMQCARPCVAFDCDSGPADIIRHGQDGWLLPADDTSALNDALRTLAADPAMRQTLGDAATAISTRLASDVVYGRWQALSDAVAARSCKKRRVGPGSMGAENE